MSGHGERPVQLGFTTHISKVDGTSTYCAILGPGCAFVHEQYRTLSINIPDKTHHWPRRSI
jgi:hypothetical protein